MANRNAGCVEAFRISNFGLEHSNPELFVSSQWNTRCACCGIVYVIYRVIVAIYWLIILVLSLVRSCARTDHAVGCLKWFIYLTNWQLLALTADAIMQGFTVIYFCVKEKKTGDSGDMDVNYLDVSTHLVNSVYGFANLFIVASPLRVYHVVHLLAYGAAYIVFSVVLKYAADISAYRAVDWSEPRTATMASFLGSIGIVALWLVLYGLYRARLAIYEAISRKRVHVVSP
ncbi:hypothetical protein LSH36_403g01033 [Paralvinella palmiformis]|uniref:Uncharacterized protein n=1 Tax=Paralvinella palmiformis TaxID=53620 RepID=A0AAD9JCJ9_9ANNE|nr:hypothetical protein LSH36_403g01033 [Paralvinella palmiformis]